MIKRWGIPLSLLMILVGSSWFLERLILDTAQQRREIAQQKPDYSVDDFATTAMDEMGLPKRRLKGKRMVHYAATDTSELEEPYLTFFAIENRDIGKEFCTIHPVWHIKSERGRVLNDGKIIFLLDKVHMWKSNDAGAMEVDIRTRNLKILPESNYGETDEPATIRTVTSETRGIGMRAHIDPGRMELLSQIQTIYKEDL